MVYRHNEILSVIKKGWNVICENMDRMDRLGEYYIK